MQSREIAFDEWEDLFIGEVDGVGGGALLASGFDALGGVLDGFWRIGFALLVGLDTAGVFGCDEVG